MVFRRVSRQRRLTFLSSATWAHFHAVLRMPSQSSWTRFHVFIISCCTYPVPSIFSPPLPSPPSPLQQWANSVLVLGLRLLHSCGSPKYVEQYLKTLLWFFLFILSHFGFAEWLNAIVNKYNRGLGLLSSVVHSDICYAPFLIFSHPSQCWARLTWEMLRGLFLDPSFCSDRTIKGSVDGWV